MPGELKFSEVSNAYNAHIANLNRARESFEEETRALNELVLEHLGDACSRPRDGVTKLRWRAPEDRSRNRDVAWINFRTGSRVRLDLKQPGFSRFKRGAAFLYFEIAYDDESAQFVFRSRLENQNNVHAEIDEQVIGLIEKQGEALYPGSSHVKRNTAVVFRRPLHDEIFENLNTYVDSAIELVESAVELLFPDSAYQGDNGETFSPAEEDEDEDSEA